MAPWREIGDRVFVRRYRFYDQTIGAILGIERVAVIDTRTTIRQAEEARSELRELTALPIVVVNTHGHHDHVFGNSVFRPCEIWGHVRCVTMIERTGERQRAEAAAAIPQLADDLAAVVLDPPDRTFETSALIDIGGRVLDLQYLGRGHTDNDVIVLVPDADVLFAGDLLENGATPYFGDSYPLDWPTTARALLELVNGVVAAGHGEPAGRAFAERQAAEFEANAALARRIHAGELDIDAAIAASPYPAPAALEPLERALAQLHGELD
jgi:glyoxylase-like metal-dependent hydrolase (beta-lactamase superfamily II)